MRSFNFNKFFLLKNESNANIVQKNLHSRIYFSFRAIQRAHAFLKSNSRYSSRPPRHLRSARCKGLHFYTRARLKCGEKKQPLLLGKTALGDHQAPAAALFRGKHSRVMFQKTQNTFTTFNFFFKKATPLVSNLEFFFLNELTVYNFKYLIANCSILNGASATASISTFLNFYLNNFFFYTKTIKNFTFTNLLSRPNSFSFVFKKFLLKTFDSGKFSIDESPLHYDSITRFLEFCSGKKIYSVFNPFMGNMLNFEEKTRCLL
jgi:hypothetical protein